MGALPVQLQNFQQLHSVQELRRNEGLSKMNPVLYIGRASCSLLGDVNQDNRIETDKRIDHHQGHSSTSQIDCKRSNRPSKGLCEAKQIDGGRQDEHPLSGQLMGSNMAISESLGMQEPPPVTSTLQMPQAVISALMAIVDSQNSKCTCTLNNFFSATGICLRSCNYRRRHL